jgi:hypothetical protein
MVRILKVCLLRFGVILKSFIDTKTVTYKDTDLNGDKFGSSSLARKPRSQSLLALSGSKKPIRADVDVFKSIDKDRGFYSDALMKVISNKSET